MKNTNFTQRLIKYFLFIVASIAAIPVILVIAYTVALWVSTDFSLDFMSIDSCFDNGGRWNYESRECEGSRY